ncbi:hypothetical protein [Enterocloster citroniae]|uniref:hypothetical protein n=1 Tax=Enterocloster citroniae TaxID=358743 RepID=UPI00349E95DA
MGDKDTVKALKYLVKRLQKLADEIEITVDKEKQRKKAKVEWMNDYKTYEDVQDAYGMGMITQAEYDAVRDALDRGEAYVELETPKSAALKELRNYISTLTNDIVGYEVDISQGYPAKRVGFHRIDPRD